MAYNRELYTLPGSALDAGIIYDQTEEKMQSEINAEVLGALADDYLPLTAGADKPLTGTLNIYRADNSPGLVLKNGLADMSGTESATRAWFLYCQDKDGDLAGFFSANHTATGRGSVAIAASNISNGSVVSNALELRMEQDGTRSVAFTSPTAWRDALGLGTSGILPITIAQGGTGQTAVTTVTASSQILASKNTNMSIVSTAYYYWGKLAHLDISLKANAAIASGAIVATLTSLIRPVAYVWLVDNIGSFYINPNSGEIGINHVINAGSTVYMRATYILK